MLQGVLKANKSDAVSEAPGERVELAKARPSPQVPAKNPAYGRVWVLVSKPRNRNGLPTNPQKQIKTI
jgi:hypothetical protein